MFPRFRLQAAYAATPVFLEQKKMNFKLVKTKLAWTTHRLHAEPCLKKNNLLHLQLQKTAIFTVGDTKFVHGSGPFLLLSLTTKRIWEQEPTSKAQ